MAQAIKWVKEALGSPRCNRCRLIMVRSSISIFIGRARWGSAVATGLAEGWPEDVRPNISYAREQRIGQTVDDIHPDVKDALGDLTEKWDASGLFSGW